MALYCLSSDSQHNPRLRIGAGHSIVTIRFRPSNAAGESNFVNALGEQLGGRYRERLQSLFPRGMAMGYPTVNFKVDGAAKVLDLLEEVLKPSGSENLVDVKAVS
jgi:hypothetical protein